MQTQTPILSLDDRVEPVSADAAVHASRRALRYLAEVPGSVVVCETMSGSLYYLSAADGDLYFWARNVSSLRSTALTGRGTWAILPPWALIIGAGLELCVPPTLELDDPARAPGGGKVTTPLARLALYPPGVIAWGGAEPIL